MRKPPHLRRLYHRLRQAGATPGHARWRLGIRLPMEAKA